MFSDLFTDSEYVIISPGLLRLLRQHSNIASKMLPFWVVFCGDITRDPCRVREITYWFQEYTDNFFFWRGSEVEAICTHFSECIAPRLD